MAFDLPIVGRGSIAVPTNQIEVSEQLEALLAVGRVLAVEVAENPSDPSQVGIKLLGKFLSAELPADAQVGKRLTVQVLDNTDQILFRILNREDSKVSAPELAIRTQIQDVLKSIGQEELKALLSADLSSELNLPPPTEGGAKLNSGGDKLAQLFEKLLKKGVMINAEKLETPKDLAETLINLDQKDLLRTLDEAQQALRSIAKATPAPAQTQFLISARTEINKIVGELTQELDAQLKILSEANVEGESESTDVEAPILKRAATAVQLPLSPSIEKKVANLLSVFKDNKFRFANLDREGDQEFAKFISETAREVQTALKSKDSNTVKDGLNKALHRLSEKLPAELTKLEENIAQAQVRTVSTLENLMQAQESLNQANKVMEAVGEPIFMLFPFLAGGLFSKLNLTVEPPRVNGDEQKKKAALGAQGFEKVDLQVNFPGLGPVNVNLAHRKGELYLNLTFGDSKITDFVKEQGAKLEERLKEHGFETPTVALATGEAQDVTPEWLKRLAAQHSVIA